MLNRPLIVLVTVIFLAINATAMANPFSDVPANHWAYASVAKLAEAGIVDGYGDGTFVGSSNMTRYEMAQITAKAMARSDKADAAMKAQIEKLAAEFADELDSLGVRVARLEKNADNVKITGEARFEHRYLRSHYTTNPKFSDSLLRSRIWLTGQVNERWQYGGMIESWQDLHSNSADSTTNRASRKPYTTHESQMSLRRAWVQGSVGEINVKAGRFLYAPLYGLVLDDDADGILLNWQKSKFDADLFALRPWFSNPNYRLKRVVGTPPINTQVWGGRLGYSPSDKFNIGAVY